jgi:hypothetical protein
MRSAMKTAFETALVLLFITACARQSPPRPYAPSAPHVTCYSANPDAGACHGNVYIPS